MKPLLIQVRPGIRQVYSLAVVLKANPSQVTETQALTLDNQRPLMGLKGNMGLYGSEEWWRNIRDGNLKSEILKGTIVETYWAGQDSRWGDEVNSFKVELSNGVLEDESIYTNRRDDKKLFKPGTKLVMAYVFDEMKSSEMLKIMLEVFVEVSSLSVDC